MMADVLVFFFELTGDITRHDSREDEEDESDEGGSHESFFPSPLPTHASSFFFRL